MSEPAVSEPAEPLPERPFEDPLFVELHLGEPQFGEPLFEDPLFVEPVLEPISPPRAELAAVPVLGGRVRPGPALRGLALPGLALPAAMLSGAVLLGEMGAEPGPVQPTPAHIATGQPTPAQPATSTESPATDAAAAASASSQTRPQTGRVVSGRVVSGRGVTGRGVIVMISILTGLVGVLEVALVGHRGAAFAIAFILTSAIAALMVRRRDLPTAIIAPPLLYCVLIAVLSVVDTHDQSGGFITRKAVYIGNAFVTGAPTLWAGTAAALAIAWYRRRAGRTPRS